MYDEQKSREHELAPELAALERQLRGVTPAAAASRSRPPHVCCGSGCSGSSRGTRPVWPGYV